MITKDLYNLLDKDALKFFPETGYWNNCCYKKSDELKKENFPCHTRDTMWLALMFQNEFKLFYLSSDFIKEYMEHSAVFKEEIHKYEQRIVKWQIDYMSNDGANWITDPELGGDLHMFSPKCDIAFRKGVVDTLLAIGMDIETIEEGIEKNVENWLLGCMHLAFCNVYDPIPYNLGETKKVNEVDKEFRENWIKMRLYEYYQEHKESVDRYGEVFPEMTMSAEEVEKLKKYLDIKGKERLEQLDNNIESKEENKKCFAKILDLFK